MAKKKIVIIPEQLAHFEGSGAYPSSSLNAPLITSVTDFHADVIVKITDAQDSTISELIEVTGSYDDNSGFNIFYSNFYYGTYHLNITQHYNDGDIENGWAIAAYNSTPDDFLVEVYYEVEVKELIDSLKTDLDRIADTINPDTTNPMLSNLDRIANKLNTTSTNPMMSNLDKIAEGVESGGGSGSGDFKLAHATVTYTGNSSITLICPCYDSEINGINIGFTLNTQVSSIESDVVVPVNGDTMFATINGQGFNENQVTLSGDAMFEEGIVLISGDCEITISDGGLPL